MHPEALRVERLRQAKSSRQESIGSSRMLKATVGLGADQKRRDYLEASTDQSPGLRGQPASHTAGWPLRVGCIGTLVSPSPPQSPCLVCRCSRAVMCSFRVQGGHP